MNSVVSLALPFFGLILLGSLCGRRLRYPEAGLQWMSFFIVYLASAISLKNSAGSAR